MLGVGKELSKKKNYLYVLATNKLSGFPFLNIREQQHFKMSTCLLNLFGGRLSCSPGWPSLIWLQIKTKG